MSSRDLFANFDRMRREVDELFGDVFDPGRRRGMFSPAVDVFYTGDPPQAVVHAELPGIDPSEVRLEIVGRELLLAGRRRPPQAEGRLYQQIEIEHGAFRRVVPLGADVDAEAGHRALPRRPARGHAAAAPRPPAEALGAHQRRAARRRVVIEIEGAGPPARAHARSRRRRASCRCATRSASPTPCCRWRSASPRRSSSSTTRSAATGRS
jgi:HSP20 family protein